MNNLNNIITVPSYLEYASQDPSALLHELAFNHNYNLDQLEIELVRRGKGYQRLFTIKTEEDKNLLLDYISHLGSNAELYSDPISGADEAAKFRKACAKSYELQDQLYSLEV